MSGGRGASAGGGGECSDKSANLVLFFSTLCKVLVSHRDVYLLIVGAAVFQDSMQLSNQPLNNFYLLKYFLNCLCFAFCLL